MNWHVGEVWSTPAPTKNRFNIHGAGQNQPFMFWLYLFKRSWLFGLFI
jgi:hypothetical protein